MNSFDMRTDQIWHPHGVFDKLKKRFMVKWLAYEEYKDDVNRNGTSQFFGTL